MNIFKKITIAPIKVYQKIIRPIMPSACVFHAHGCLGCSDYAIAAIQKYGPIKGVLIGAARILRCHPRQKNFDDVEP